MYLDLEVRDEGGFWNSGNRDRAGTTIPSEQDTAVGSFIQFS